MLGCNLSLSDSPISRVLAVPFPPSGSAASTFSRKAASLGKRLVKIIGEINSDSYQKFSDEMDELEAAAKSPINIELASGGGDTYFGLAFYGRITTSRCLTRINAYGLVMSAASIILAGGSFRSMHKDCWFMVHDDSQRVRADNTKIAISEATHSETLEQHWATILSRHSNIDAAEWRKLSAKTTYLSAVSCKSFGVIHEILR